MYAANSRFTDVVASLKLDARFGIYTTAGQPARSFAGCRFSLNNQTCSFRFYAYTKCMVNTILIECISRLVKPCICYFSVLSEQLDATPSPASTNESVR